MIKHSYPLLDELSLIEGIRVASLKDLAAFKLNAVAGRGSKKDFWDVATLLDHYSMKQMLDFFSQKYPVADLWHLIKSLTYFGDAEAEQIQILDLQGKSWELIKNLILTAVMELQPINE
jgi:predicted nucleotidyltransferase component of viral defense system